MALPTLKTRLIGTLNASSTFVCTLAHLLQSIAVLGFSKK
jgi:hypothetical protein|tara:strand:+ start:122 stop:241 length:120 start_codon:yes stop_codon:yes gene_type:complete